MLARGVRGLVGRDLVKVGGGGGGMAILSLSSPSFPMFSSLTSSSFRSFLPGPSPTGMLSSLSGVEVVILGVSSSILEGASLGSVIEGGGGGRRVWNQVRRLHVEGGCL